MYRQRSICRVLSVALISYVYFAFAGVPQHALYAQQKDDGEKYIREHFTRQTHQIPMRDGARLCTIVYAPKDASQPHPILMVRTPYSIAPYENDKYRTTLGPNRILEREDYIFVYQDVRGCYMSEGKFDNMRPHRPGKANKQDIDESSDTYDTIEWLVANVPNHNGRVGMWGISYPGFYAAAGMIDAHPALKAVSPQAPIADWFFDDFHHHGAFFLPHAFNFFSTFGWPRPEPTTRSADRFDYKTPDGYQFYLDLGPLKNANERHFKDRITFWKRLAEHPNYDSFWQARNLLPHLKKVAPAVMTVGGWYDAEDLYGALNTYQAIEKQNPDVFNMIVMGPWHHGGWSRGDGESLGNIHFGSKTGLFFQKNMEAAFFDHFLKDKGTLKLPEAYMFETGVNRWREFDFWPPRNMQAKTLYFRGDGKLAFAAPAEDGAVHDEYISDPGKPVPFSESVTNVMTTEYMTDDQRFAAHRPDVLTYESEILTNPLTLAGPVVADLRVSTSGTDSDWVVKLIDVFPRDAQDYPSMRPGEHLGGYQMMVRSEVMRGRFRTSYEKPEPFVPNQVTRVSLPLQDVLHTFARGHRIMVQVQSTWFPLVDRNPQKYVANIFQADAMDFIKATQRVYRSKSQPSSIRVNVLPAE